MGGGGGGERENEQRHKGHVLISDLYIGVVLLIGASLSEPHLYQYYEKNHVPMYVCMYVAIHCPRAHHASALACTHATKSKWVKIVNV